MPDSIDKKRVLFLCTGNSCRSQLAEAIVNARLGSRWEAFSAGSKPAGYVHPNAINVLSEIGIEHQGRSKSNQEFLGQAFDLVITLCADAEDECPVWLGKGEKLHMPYPDPARASGSEAEKLATFRQVRDGIADKITDLLERY
jgi:arsenate reductase